MVLLVEVVEFLDYRRLPLWRVAVGWKQRWRELAHVNLGLGVLHGGADMVVVRHRGVARKERVLLTASLDLQVSSLHGLLKQVVLHGLLRVREVRIVGERLSVLASVVGLDGALDGLTVVPGRLGRLRS